MSVLIIPQEARLYTLGPLVSLWMEQSLCFGLGSMRGEPYKLDDSKKALLNRIYEINPPGTITEEGKDISGRRHFKRVGISVRKGWAKSEIGAGICAAELAPYAPVRFNGWATGGEPTGLKLYPEYKAGEPMGIGVYEPYIPMIAFTEEQSNELAYGALKVMLEDGPIKDQFSIGEEKIFALDESGKAIGRAVSLAGSPNARDGARTSMNFVDEPLALDTPIPTTDGWKMMGNIRAGDYVFGRDGTPALVFGTSPIHKDRQCFRITFDDKTSVVADASHVWKAMDWGRRHTFRYEELVTTQTMFDRGCYTSDKPRWRLPLSRFSSRPHDSIIGIDPVDSVPVRCLAVDNEDHLFLVGRGLHLTHNSHRWDSDKLLKTHQTLLANIPKRYEADAWTLEVTTAYEPGLGSVAEKTYEYAKQISEGKVKDSKLFFFHRQASDKFKLRDKDENPDPKQMREAVIDASGKDVAQWSDIDAIVDLGLDPTTDFSLWERLWTNRNVQQSLQAFPIGLIDQLAHPGWMPPKGSMVTFGFDGAQTKDTTAIVGTSLAKETLGRQFLLGVWQNPGIEKNWRVPASEVDASVSFMFKNWNVKRFYCDPFYWNEHIAEWVAKYMYRGNPRVYEWATNTQKKMYEAIQAYISAMSEGTWSFDGDKNFRAHLANARKHFLNMVDEDGNNCYVIRKERSDSPLKIDIAMAGCLSWQAYLDVIAANENHEPSRRLLEL